MFVSSFFSGDVNETHWLPINTEPVSPPHLYQWLLRDYRMPWSEWDYRVSLLWRKGFRVCQNNLLFHKDFDIPIWREDCWDVIQPWSEYDVVDMKDVWDVRFTLMHDKKKQYWYLFRSCLDKCWSCSWITRWCCGEPLWASNQFPIDLCTAEEIEVVSMPKWECTNWTFTIKNVLVWTSILWLLCPEWATSSRNQNCWITIDECWSEWYSWQTKEIVWTFDWCYLLDTPRQGINDNISVEEIQELALNNLQSTTFDTTEDFLNHVKGIEQESFNEVQEVKDIPWCIRCDYWPVPVVATTEWLKYDANTDCTETPLCDKLVCFGNTTRWPWDTPLSVTSMFMYDWQFWYLTWTWFVFMGWFGLNNWYFSVANTIDVWDNYTKAKVIWWIVMLFWPENLWYMYREGNNFTGISTLWYEHLADIWYLTECSIDENLWNLYLIGSDKELYSVNVNYTWDNIFWAARYKPQLTNISKYIRDWLKAIDLCDADKICLSVDNQRIQLFLGNVWWKIVKNILDEDITEEYERCWGTIILNFEIYHQYRHMRVVCWEDICGKYKDCYYGDTVYEYEWCLDWSLPIMLNWDIVYGNWTPYKQWVWMFVIDNNQWWVDNVWLFWTYSYEDIAFMLWDQHYIAKKYKVREFNLALVEELEPTSYEGRSIVRARYTHCWRERVRWWDIKDICFLREIEVQRRKPIEEVTLEPIDASQDMALEDIYNIGWPAKEREYCNIPERCEDEPLVKELKLCIEESDCECDDIGSIFDSSDYVRYARWAVIRLPIKQEANHMFLEIQCTGWDILHIVGMWAEINIQKGHWWCSCNTITCLPEALHKVCKEKIHTNSSARE